jgi:hypothetical protein
MCGLVSAGSTKQLIDVISLLLQASSLGGRMTDMTDMARLFHSCRDQKFIPNLFRSKVTYK